MAEPRSAATRRLQLEYRFDRLSPDKLAQAYHLLVPERRRAIESSSAENPTIEEVNDEQARGDLCSSLIRPAEGATHNRESDSGTDRSRTGKRLYRTGGMDF